MKNYFSVLMAGSLMLLAACSSGLDRKLDGSSEAAFTTSLGGMKKSCKATEVVQLDQALLMLAVADVSIGYEGGILGAFDKLAASERPEQLAAALMPLVDGKTGHELIAAGQKRSKSEAGRQLAKVNAELAQLLKAREQRDAVKGLLSAIQVLEPSLSFNSASSQRSSMIEFKIQNGTNLPLRYLNLRANVAAADEPRSAPLFADDINYKLSDPLLPGETKSIRLPNADPGKWNAPEIWGRRNIVFSIEVINAETEPGKKLAGAFGFKDGQRLAQLETDKPRLEKMLAN